MKDEIIENQAYHILLLDLYGIPIIHEIMEIGRNVDEKAIDCLFQLIEIGLFPCLRIIDFYSIRPI